MQSKDFYSVVVGWNLKGKLAGMVPALFAVMFGFFALVEPSYAGLQKADDALDEIKAWAYGILGIGIFLYIMYHVVMALMNKGSWADVVMAIVYSAVAGAVLVLGDWAWSIWGS